MAKKFKDIRIDPESKSVDLRKDSAHNKLHQNADKLTKKKHKVYYKKEAPIKSVSDIAGPIHQQNFQYVKGRNFTPPKYFGNLLRLSFAGFFIIMLINTVNVYVTGKAIEKEISATAYEGYQHLIDAGKDATKIQFDQALSAFNKALENFSQAEDQLWFVSQDKTFYAREDSTGQAAKMMLESGQHFSIAGKYFLDALEEFNKTPLFFVSKNDPESTSKISITDTLKDGLNKTDLAIKEISIAAEKIAQINEKTLPPDLTARVIFAKKNIEEVSKTLTSVSEHFPALLNLLGDRYPHRYLIILQNNNEIRPTGGFIGSYAIMDINDGYIEKLETHDVYDLDGSFGGMIEPPEEFKAFTSNWRFRDSNYSPDFAVSAQKMRWFLEKEGGPSVDTVIGINQGLLKDMLDITGPVQVGNFGKLNAENYNLLLSYIIEGKVWGAEDPKRILKVFVPAFKEAILKEENISKVTSKLYKAVQQKHIMMYSGNTDIQALFDAMGLSGRVHETAEKEDYLSVINISVGGTKSEQFMEENIEHDTYIDEYGNIVNEVKISRSHLWADAVYYEWKKILQNYGFSDMPDTLIDVLGRGQNRIVMRVYVPEGSKLIESNGKDVATQYDKDLKKTYFTTTMQTFAGKTTTLTIKYKLPFILDLKSADNYKLIVEKQPGTRGSIFTKTVHTDPGVENLDFYPEEARIDQDNEIIYATTLLYDRYFSSIWRK